MSNQEKAQEQRVRRLADRMDYRVEKSRRQLHAAEQRKRMLADLALSIWGRILDLAGGDPRCRPGLAEGQPLEDIVAVMDEQMVTDLLRAIPLAREFIADLERGVEQKREAEEVMAR